MLLVREIMFCKPGKVKQLAQKFLAMDKLGAKIGMPRMRVMTDVSSERYWMLVAEMEVESLEEFEKSMRGPGEADPETMKKFEEIMSDYHDLVESGRREIYRIEE